MTITNQSTASVCSECGAVLRQDETVCTQCGCPAEQAQNTSSFATVLCKECGAVLERGSATCRSCGAPVAAAAAVSRPNYGVDDPEAKAKKRFIIYNIYGLLTMIPAAITFMGKLFTFKLADNTISFGFMDFSDKNESINELLSALKSIDGGLFDEMRRMTVLFGYVKYVFIALLIFSAIIFFIGWFKLKNGKISFSFWIPGIYFLTSFIFIKLLDYYLISPIDNFLNDNIAAQVIQLFVGKTNISLEFSPDIAVICIFAFVNGFLAIVLGIAENHTASRRNGR